METRNGSRGRVGFIGFALLVISILIVAAVLYPVFRRTDGDARKGYCQYHLKFLALSFDMYQNDYNGIYPSSAAAGARSFASSDDRFRKTRGYVPPTVGKSQAGTWPEMIYPYKRDDKLIFCPMDDYSNAPDAQISYVLKKAMHQAWWGVGMPKGQTARKAVDFRTAADQILLYERRGWHWGDYRKGDMSVKPVSGVTLNMAFMDGHVATKRLPSPLNGEPDYYNADSRTWKHVKAKVDPRIYADITD